MNKRKANPGAPGFTREQLARSQMFQGRRDAVTAVLHSGQTYTREQAQSLLEEFLNRKVK